MNHRGQKNDPYQRSKQQNVSGKKFSHFEDSQKMKQAFEIKDYVAIGIFIFLFFWFILPLGCALLSFDPMVSLTVLVVIAIVGHSILSKNPKLKAFLGSLLSKIFYKTLEVTNSDFKGSYNKEKEQFRVSVNIGDAQREREKKLRKAAKKAEEEGKPTPVPIVSPGKTSAYLRATGLTEFHIVVPSVSTSQSLELSALLIEPTLYKSLRIQPQDNPLKRVLLIPPDSDKDLYNRDTSLKKTVSFSEDVLKLLTNHLEMLHQKGDVSDEEIQQFYEEQNKALLIQKFFLAKAAKRAKNLIEENELELGYQLKLEEATLYKAANDKMGYWMSSFKREKLVYPLAKVLAEKKEK